MMKFTNKRFLSLILSLAFVLNLFFAVSPVTFAAETEDESVINYDELINIDTACKVIDKDGNLWSWGWNFFGKLGLGISDAYLYCLTSPAKVTSNVKCIMSDGSSFLKTDGSLWFVGEKNPSNYGKVVRNAVTTPSKVLSNVAFSTETKAIKNDGTLWSWGQNANGTRINGKVGNGSTTSQIKPVKIMDNVVSVVETSSAAAAIKEDKSLWIWGINKNGIMGEGVGNAENANDLLQTVPLKIMEKVSAFTMYANTAAAIKEDRSLWMWGSGHQGILGTGNQSNASAPQKVLDSVKSVHLSGNTTAAIKEDDSLWMWGANAYGQIGNNGEGNEAYRFNASQAIQSIPVKVLDNVEKVYLADKFTLALKYDGTLWFWGYDHIGTQNAISSTVPIKILENVKDFFATSDFVAALKKDSTLWMWGENSNGEVGNGTTAPVKSPEKVLDDVIYVTSYTPNEGGVLAAVKKDGTLWLWGDDQYAQTGVHDSSAIESYDPNRPDVTTPVQVPNIILETKPMNQPETPAETKPDAIPVAKSFDDVSETRWSYSNIMICVEKGVIGGTRTPDANGVGSFDPKGKVTLGQFLAITTRLVCPENIKEVEGHWALKNYVAAVDSGIIKGDDFNSTTSALNAVLSREDMAYIMVGVAKVNGENLKMIGGIESNIPDYNSVSENRKDAVLRCYSNGLIAGYGDGSFGPMDTMTREQMATAVCRLMGYSPRAEVNYKGNS